MDDDLKNRTGVSANRRSGESVNRRAGVSAYRQTDEPILLDLRGVACPLNFVKTKIQLEKMNKGQILEVWLDPGEAIESVPPSVIAEGHEILNKECIDNYFNLKIKKN